MNLDHVLNNRWCVLDGGRVPEAGWTPIPRAGDDFDDSAMFDHIFEHPGDTVVQAFDHATEGPIFYAHRGPVFSTRYCRTLDQAIASLTALEKMMAEPDEARRQRYFLEAFVHQEERR